MRIIAFADSLSLVFKLCQTPHRIYIVFTWAEFSLLFILSSVGPETEGEEGEVQSHGWRLPGKPVTDDISFANFNDQAVSFSKKMPKNPHVSADVLKVVTTAFETVFLWYPRRCQKIWHYSLLLPRRFTKSWHYSLLLPRRFPKSWHYSQFLTVGSQQCCHCSLCKHFFCSSRRCPKSCHCSLCKQFFCLTRRCPKSLHYSPFFTPQVPKKMSVQNVDYNVCSQDISRMKVKVRQGPKHQPSGFSWALSMTQLSPFFMLIGDPDQHSGTCSILK